MLLNALPTATVSTTASASACQGRRRPQQSSRRPLFASVLAACCCICSWQLVAFCGSQAVRHSSQLPGSWQSSIARAAAKERKPSKATLEKQRKMAQQDAARERKKEDKIEINGVVIQHARNLWKVELENGAVVPCTIGGRLRKASIKVIEGDKVTVEMSPFDLTRGRITYRTIDQMPDQEGGGGKKKGKR
mmetsp:Transcript_28336/g.65676  ORF Transcript_28336/g.65676 Transcript_28336/m.65676 type:complete len:191 (+) Transcript_28336:97-669(+)|eukprot:CAMPEP_0178420534 /NCGR_PEP_ID=MMETSP0689_2-20121128/26182_1 /TAXON_ID=160604 /ORGANISM="Amphidinium massartii, Strain CS-259" /LENGTH=190 /DNA_ID=CAMNT_0020042019 /DNA_START=82 /DNA_END=654 /DNA_ORIENTATION=-